MDRRTPEELILDPLPALPSDIIDVDEQGEQALREKYGDSRVQRKPLNREQGLGDEFA